MRRGRVIAVAAAGALAVAAWVLTRRTVRPGPVPPPPPGAGVREPRNTPPLAPAGTAFADD